MKNKTNQKNASRESNVNVNHTTTNIQHKTYNNEQVTTNTTFASSDAEKEVLVSTSSLPVRKKDLAILEEEVVAARQRREQKKTEQNAEHKALQDERRKQIQQGKEHEAKYIINNSQSIFRIEASCHSKGNKINIDILHTAGTKFLHCISNLQGSRSRDVTANMASKYKDWWGYEEAKEHITDGMFAGKIRLRQTTGKLTRIAPKVIPKTAVLLYPNPRQGVVADLKVIIGDAEYPIELKEYDNEYFSLKGIYQAEEECMDIDV